MNFFELLLFFSAINFARYFLICGSAYFMFWIVNNPWTKKNRIQSHDFVHQDLRKEFLNSCVTCIIFGLVLSLIFYPNRNMNMMAPSQITLSVFIIQMLGLILVHDTYFYWMHRALHVPLLFKWVHKTHHHSRNPSPWAALSFHPIEAFLEIVWIVPIKFIFDIDMMVWASFGVFMMAINAMGHLNVEIYPQTWKQNRALKYLTFSHCHNDHHFYFTGNYGLYFTFWDRLIGTYRRNAKSISLSN